MTKHCRDNQIARINQILDAIQYFKDWRRYGSAEQAMELLTQVQQIVIVIGTVLEQDFQDYRFLVSELEQLCELLYQMGISLEDNEHVKKLESDAEGILKGVRRELQAVRLRKEIAFLPYQVSMWDSLESVWQTARDDAEVDAYVVPIPFYDVLPDNSVGALHDQRDDYPKDVPVTPYENYALEERHPDVIFFHNPYDDCNTVTRVPERYYSSRLRKCTELLVYIPYFVSEESGPADHQCYMPGVLFADKVVVQPGSIYEKYCQVYSQARKENGWEELLSSSEEKFLPLSSPKFDKVLNTSCEIEDLPESWRRVILKPDGSRKKIILYNLTIAALLRNNEYMLKKVDNVFNIFKEKQGEVALLWRPHPLLLSTINSMRPQLRDAYLMRLEQFKKEGWGIFDETPDANLAMALSDAYYGDWSSLLMTYRVLGKPMLIQRLELADESDFILQVMNDNGVRRDKEIAVCEGKGEPNQIGRAIYHRIMLTKAFEGE